ncbi:hypothetical protein H9P43_001940 [Blastocladiella emersonii ATCC 22665]|nr:hypothetical protein H9P43_001940 [Blastocladiella emersonii ATCC 22665]
METLHVSATAVAATADAVVRSLLQIRVGSGISEWSSWASWIRLVATLGASAASAIVILLLRERRLKLRRDLPTTPPHLLLGHARGLLRRQGERLHRAWRRQRAYLDAGLGPNSHVYVPFGATYVTTCEPLNLEHVLKLNFENYVKGPKFHAIHAPLLGNGIFASDGPHWKAQRKAASHLFSVAAFRDHYLDVFRERCRAVVAKLALAADQSENGAEVTVDLSDYLYRFTLDSFMAIGFGLEDLQALDAPDGTPVPFAIAFDETQRILNKRFNMSELQWTLAEWLNGDRARLQQYTATIHGLAHEIIAARHAEPAEVSAARKDLLARFMALRKPAEGDAGLILSATSDSACPSSTTYSDTELRDMILNFVIAGRDTTAQSLSWTMFELICNPRALAAFRAEIDRVCPDGAEPDYHALTKELKYGQAVLSEGLRLHPSVPTEIKFAVYDDVWPDGTRIRAGEGVVWIPWVMGRLTELWGDDAAEYRPERWLDEHGGKNKHPGPFKYPVFNAGPRTCLGQQMVMLQGVACLVELVRRFDFEVVDPAAVTYQPALTLQFKDGLMLRVRHRGGFGPGSASAPASASSRGCDDGGAAASALIAATA